MRTAIAYPMFGAPNNPYFIPATEAAVIAASSSHAATSHFGHAFTEYLCRYCVGDPLVRAEAACWHQRASMQIDHILPWNQVFGSEVYDVYTPDFVNAGVLAVGANGVDWSNAQLVQIIYNDLDNLRLVCTAHNSMGHKGGSTTFHGKNQMGIPNLVHHKI